MLFELIKLNKYDEIYNLIKRREITDLDIRDTYYIYFIEYLIIYNQYKILKLILHYLKKNLIKIRLDIL